MNKILNRDSCLHNFEQRKRFRIRLKKVAKNEVPASTFSRQFGRPPHSSLSTVINGQMRWQLCNRSTSSFHLPLWIIEASSCEEILYSLGFFILILTSLSLKSLASPRTRWHPSAQWQTVRWGSDNCAIDQPLPPFPTLSINQLLTNHSHPESPNRFRTILQSLQFNRSFRSHTHWSGRKPNHENIPLSLHFAHSPAALTSERAC